MSDTSQRDREVFGTDVGEVRHEPAAGRRLWVYAAVLCAWPFALILGTLYWIGTPAYVRHSQYPSFVGIGYGMREHDADCDVVIDGDSTAMVGVEPAVVERLTGLKACNIAEMAGVMVVNDQLVLRHYLEHNRRPKYIVFLFAPEDLTPPSGWTTVATFEGVFLRMQYQPDAAFLRYAVTHPELLLTTDELGLRTGLQWMFSKPLPPEPGATLTVCPQTIILREPDRAWLDGLRKEFGRDGTTVLIDATPEPACAPDRSFYEPRLKPPVTDNTLGTLPLEDYTDTGRLHTNDAGAALLSETVGAQIARMNAGAAKQGDR